MIGDPALLQTLGDGFPAELDELGGIGRVDAFCQHVLIGQDGTSLQHAAKNGLLAHQVGFDFGDE